MTDLQALHAAGACIPGHADAWLALGRQTRVLAGRLDLVATVTRLHRELGRDVVPADIPDPHPPGRPRSIPTANPGTR